MGGCAGSKQGKQEIGKSPPGLHAAPPQHDKAASVPPPLPVQSSPLDPHQSNLNHPAEHAAPRSVIKPQPEPPRDYPEIDKTQNRGLGSTIKQAVAMESPNEPESGVEEVGVLRSSIDRVQSTVSRPRQALSRVAEQQEQQVHEEGVSSFAVPIKNINLHVQVR